MLKVIFIAAIWLGLASCSSKKEVDIEDNFIKQTNSANVNKIQFDSKSVETFLTVLSAEYLERSKEFKRNGYHPDAQNFLKKSKLAKERDATHYTEDTYALSPKNKDKAQLARLFMDKIRSNVLIFDLFPEPIARMQSYYDCMIIEMRDEGYEKKRRNHCRNQFDKLQKSFQRSGYTKNIKYYEEVEKRQTFVIYFDLNSDKITSEYYEILYKLSKKALELENYKIDVVGLTDKTGTRAINYPLSQRRAVAVQNALIKMGVPKNKISINYLADEFVLIKTQKAEKFNRRVVVDLVGF
jgi:outer membrane protein OmpA-like peptidoglycan-associated protein